MAPPSDGGVRDMYGFIVKPEYAELYEKFAGIYAAEEAQRSQLWEAYLRDLREAVGEGPAGEDDTALLSRALVSLGAAAEAGEAQPQAAPLLQRLSSLVQAGLPMPRRGAFWRLFLGVAAKRQAGEYQRLVAEVEALERLGSPSSSPGLPSSAFAAAAEAKPCDLPSTSHSTYSVVADGSTSGAAVAAAARSAAAALRRIDTFSLTPLADCDESPACTPAKPGGGPPAGSDAAAAGAADAAGAAAPPEALPCKATPQGEGGPEPLATPSSTLATPHTAFSSGSTSTGGGGGGGVASPFVVVTPASTAAAAGPDGGTTSGGGQASSPAKASSGSIAAHMEERWRQQDYLAQIDKDLHRTFPGHPCMGEEGRATLRRILSAYARRNPVVGYCQGLNFLAACLMLHMGEEEAFWSLCALIEDVLGSSYFDERMVLPQVDVLVFGQLLSGRFPTLAAHLAALEVDAASVTMSWYLLCFLTALPLESTLRVWDLLFFERSPVVLFRVALSLVEIYLEALSCTRESSDAYMLLQCCAQMTFDSSRLVDTACIGFSHLRDAGLRVLRQRYLPAVLDNLRGAFASEDEYASFVSSQHEGASPTKAAAAAAAGGGGFAAAFQRASSAVLEAEEAAARQRQQEAGGSPGDSGHLSMRAGSSRRSSPGSLAGSAAGGSQPASPLVRVRQAVSGLTSRLMPSSLPQLLPAGAVDAAGQELPVSSSSRSSPAHWPPPAPARHASCPDQPAAAAAAAPPLRRISTAGRSSADAASPTAGLTGSAGTGAALGRRAPGLTPFSEPDAVLSGSQPQQEERRQQQQWQQQPGSDASAPPSWTPPRPAAPSPAGLLPRGPGFGPAAVAQSQPATPSELLRPPQPPPSHRRAFTFSYPTTEGGHSRRRRRLTIDLLHMANVRPDLGQPALAAAFAIAANPSPRAPGPLGRASGSFGGGAGVAASPLSGRRPSPSPPGVGARTPAVGGSVRSSGVGGGFGGAGGDDDQLPIRALRFEDSEGPGSSGAACFVEHGGGDGGEEGPGLVRRAITAPPAPWRPAAVAEGEEEEEPGAAEDEQLPLSQSALWRSSEEGEAPAAGAAGGSPAADSQVQAGGWAGPRGFSQDTAATSTSASLNDSTGSGSSGGSGGSGAAAWSPGPARPPLPAAATHGGEARQQSRQALLAVVAQLQEEVALAESRRHAVEQEAAAQAQMAADLARQLAKVQAQVAAKEALVGELSAKLQASSAALGDLDGELRAAQMAVDAEEAVAARQRRQLAAADALIERLMDAHTACCKGGGGSGGSTASSASRVAAYDSSTADSAGSPQSSSGSAMGSGAP